MILRCIFAAASFCEVLIAIKAQQPYGQLAELLCLQAFGFQLRNGIPIESWYSDEADHELLDLLPFLERCAVADDVRPLVQAQFKLEQVCAVCVKTCIVWRRACVMACGAKVDISPVHELLDLLPFLERCAVADDVRPLVQTQFKLEQVRLSATCACIVEMCLCDGLWSQTCQNGGLQLAACDLIPIKVQPGPTLQLLLSSAQCCMRVLVRFLTAVWHCCLALHSAVAHSIMLLPGGRERARLIALHRDILRHLRGRL